MHWEVEQKFRVDDPEAIRGRLVAMGVQFQAAETQVDHYFQHPSRDFAKTDEALRLRQIGAANFITYKGPKIDAVTKTRRELELPLSGGAAALTQFAELFSALGFTTAGIVRKQRQRGLLAWASQYVEVVLDAVDDLGPFVELEIGATDETLPEARAALESLGKHIGLTIAERRSYLELLLGKTPN
jgi:adenylate cyclase class 2